MEPVPPAVEAQSLNHRTARDTPILLFKLKKKITVNYLKFTMYEVTFFMLWLLALPKYKFVCLGTSRNMRDYGSLQGDQRAPDTWWVALLSGEKQGILVSTTRSENLRLLSILGDLVHAENPAPVPGPEKVLSKQPCLLSCINHDIRNHLIELWF